MIELVSSVIKCNQHLKKQHHGAQGSAQGIANKMQIKFKFVQCVQIHIFDTCTLNKYIFTNQLLRHKSKLSVIAYFCSDEGRESVLSVTIHPSLHSPCLYSASSSHREEAGNTPWTGHQSITHQSSTPRGYVASYLATNRPEFAHSSRGCNI